ncbi:MAG TPA: isochorismatase family protein [Bryobacteraceae bacterium]|nr:isochorismatase family protein [Bryobacteraceae bacterium]
MPDRYTEPEPARSALLTIDVQRDFAEPGAPAEIAGTADCVPAMRTVLTAYRQAGLPIVHVVRLYLADGSNADICRREMLENGEAFVSPGSDGAEILDSLKRGPDIRLDAAALLASKLQPAGNNEWILCKPRWDAFHATTLEPHLRECGVTTVVVVGCNFPNCPRSTVYSASMRDFRAVLIRDAVSGVYERGLAELVNIGVATPSSVEWAEKISRLSPA